MKAMDLPSGSPTIHVCDDAGRVGYLRASHIVDFRTIMTWDTPWMDWLEHTR